jgi:hypothetical protein
MTERSRCGRAWSQVRIAVASTPCSINSLRRLIARSAGLIVPTVHTGPYTHVQFLCRSLLMVRAAWMPLAASIALECKENCKGRDISHSTQFCIPSIVHVRKIEDGQATTSNTGQSLDIGLSASSGSCRRSKSRHDMSNAPWPRCPAHLSLKPQLLPSQAVSSHQQVTYWEEL